MPVFMPNKRVSRHFLASVDKMTPAEFKAARHALGLSAERLARLFKVSSGRTVRRWERGDRDIPGPAKVLMKWLATGRKPKLP